MLPALGLTSGVDAALGRAGAAPNSLSFAHWFIPQIFAECLSGIPESPLHLSLHAIHTHSLIREVTPLTPFYR